MVDLKDKKLNKKLKELEKQKLPSIDNIKKENKELEHEEKSFLHKFFKNVRNRRKPK